jgi:putative transposase
MPRIARVAGGGIVQHVLNRGNGRMKLFHKPQDYQAFIDLIGEALDRVPGMRLLGWCMMPNHWHLVLWPREDPDLSAFMRWLSNTHVRRWRQHWHSVGQGHVYQGRFKSFLVQSDEHYLTLLRYVEANPLRAKMVPRAQDWRWSSLTTGTTSFGRSLLSQGPLNRPRNWLAKVNERLDGSVLSAIRTSATRGRPFGDERWTAGIAARLGLQFTLRPRGRPKEVEAGSTFRRVGKPGQP